MLKSKRSLRIRFVEIGEISIRDHDLVDLEWINAFHCILPSTVRYGNFIVGFLRRECSGYPEGWTLDIVVIHQPPEEQRLPLQTCSPSRNTGYGQIHPLIARQHKIFELKSKTDRVKTDPLDRDGVPFQTVIDLAL